MAIACALSSITGGIASLLVMPPITVGYALFCNRIYKSEKGDVGEMFSVGFNNYGRNLGGILWMQLFTWLWSLLFIVPGIIKALAYFMTSYILADSKDVAPTNALKLSMRMTKGHKGKIFVMGLSFIGWGLLSAITFGLVWILYAGPYMVTSFAGLYQEIRQNAIENVIITEAELA